MYGTVSALTTMDNSYESYKSWCQHHGKIEDSERFAIWQENFKLVEQHNAKYNAGTSTFYLSMKTQHADLTNKEYKFFLLKSKSRGKNNAHFTFTAEQISSTSSDIPQNWSWVEQGVISPIKNQGQCGSCWAFSATAAMEGEFNRRNNGSLPSTCISKCGKMNNTCCSFSNQEVADCTRGGADTCNIGGEPHDGILFVAKTNKGQINTDEQYPYSSGTSGKLTKCTPQTSNAITTGVTGYANVTSGDEEALKQAAYKYATISVGIDASSFLFQLYAGGIYNDDKCKNTPKALNHGVSIVGYGVGTPKPVGPPGPKPGPANCENNHYKPSCQGEKGCDWCTDKSGFGWCQNTACSSKMMDVSSPKKKPTEYYIVKNSWGIDWGMNGYIAMSRNANNQCGIATDAVFALF
eukprot:g12932.t1